VFARANTKSADLIIITCLQWSQYYKTSCAKELAPYDADWIYTRAASVCYQLYMLNGSGVLRLRHHYGGKQRRGTKTEHTRIAAGKVIRYCLNQLVKSGIVSERNFQAEDGKKMAYGKVLGQKGITDMDRIAAQIGKEARK
jgi:small subunit ribosomal protein S19e